MTVVKATISTKYTIMTHDEWYAGGKRPISYEPLLFSFGDCAPNQRRVHIIVRPEGKNTTITFEDNLQHKLRFKLSWDSSANQAEMGRIVGQWLKEKCGLHFMRGNAFSWEVVGGDK